MPIKPIDLQTLFMQMNQVSREQSAAKEGVMLQQSIQGTLNQKRLEGEVRSVQRPQADENSGRVGDRQSGSAPEGGPEGEQTPDKRDESGKPEVVKDPNLGRRIDISG